MAQTPFDVLMDAAQVYVVSRCVNAVAEARIADALDDAPRTAKQLAAATRTHADALSRILRVLSSYGIFEARDGAYIHTPASRLLRKDHPQSLQAYALMINLPFCWKSIEAIGHSLRTGGPSHDEAGHGGWWKYLASHPEEQRIFNEAMIAKAQGQVAGVLASYDFSRFGVIADIGGGHGHLLQAVLTAAPKAKGILFEQPQVIEEASAVASDRLKLQAGDFFHDPLPVADAYLIMQVIHDWPDAEATKILRAIRRPAHANAKLLLIELLIPEKPGPDWAKVLDLFMLTMLAGKERTQSEYKDLLAGAGFRLERTIEVGQSTAILEASPA
jgi:hypothetical protein